MTTKYLTLTGYEGGDELPVIQQMDYDQAFGAVPDWLMLLDPDDVDGEDGAWNRALEGTLAAVDSSPNYGIPLGTFANGQTSFEPADNDFTSFNPNIAIPVNAWTFFGVARPTPRSVSSNNFLTAKSSVSDPELSPRIGFNGAGTMFGLYDNQQNANNDNFRVFYTPATNFLDRDTLLMVTFSTRDGLRIFENGVLVATEAADQAPFTAAFGAGEWNVLAYARGQFGVMGLLAADLGWTEKAHQRRLIEGAMLTKYGIS